ncbi:hypothetical protein NMH_1011 [Neisseria meningitidis H44/76]|uniref:Uncharacterized protein n=1 Tax=Neisseria meningitidis serogroup B / serotype 15 (strain H44/76) TaxID=909420 RepID=E6MWH1_NEIMH|nr:hypothetical protein NMH_1011 [Neisseria meningitidis H44/76]
MAGLGLSVECRLVRERCSCQVSDGQGRLLRPAEREWAVI